MTPPLHLRALGLGLGLAFVFGGPFARQVLYYDAPLLKSWRPYGGPWLDVCVADYAMPQPDGSWAPVSRLKTLYEAEAWWQVALHRRRLRSQAEAHRAGRRMCQALGVPDLRARVKCATDEGYHYVEDRERNLCRPL